MRCKDLKARLRGLYEESKDLERERDKIDKCLNEIEYEIGILEDEIMRLCDE